MGGVGALFPTRTHQAFGPAAVLGHDGSDDSDDEPAQPRRFSLPDVNRKLAALGPRES